jgi:membrane-bound serine protease (ClpP class)
MKVRNWIRWVGLLAWVAAGILAAFQPGTAQAQSGAPTAVVVTLDGPLNPIWEEMIDRGIQAAQERDAEILVLKLNTPGGEVTLMSKLISQIRNSPVPVVVYVSPAGAMAGSAGTMLTLAGHAAAMAPETAIGAASPVGSEGEDVGETMEAKLKEMFKATARSLASHRGEEAIRLAEAAIDDARAVSSDEALQAGLIDFIARDVSDLLNQLDGFTIPFQGSERVLHTGGAVVVEMQATFLEQLLQVMANPNLVFILLSVGIQAILIEISSPGGWVAGFIGAVCIALAVFGMGILPVNWFGVIFLVISFVLFILDIKAPTHGALTAAGVASFIVGALVLFNSPRVPDFQRVSVPLVVGTGLAIGGLFFVIMTFALRALHIPVQTGMESLVGQVGVARTELAPGGSVQLGSELWTAVLEHPSGRVPKGSRVEVVGREGIQLRVRKVDNPQ